MFEDLSLQTTLTTFEPQLDVILTSIILIVAYLVRGIAGFGSGLIAIPLLSLIHPLSVAVPLVVLLDYLGSASQGFKGRENILWSELVPLLPFTIVGCIAALWLFSSVDVGQLTQALGYFVLVFAVYQLLPLPDLRGSRIWSAPTGFLGGLVGTLFGTGGPLYMIYLNLRGMNKTQTRANFATYFFVDGSIRLVGFFVIGLLNPIVLQMLLWWLPAAVIGLYVGGRVHADIADKTFKYFISLLLVFSGYRLITG